ncbi:hypothetical protein [Nocardia tengchongensis]|uniref:hypothetical protein n=1 Tax=Nocardia tengchongensis TaxID=2055889 RepID=UPI003685CD53
MIWNWGIPAAFVAINTLLTAVSYTHRRRCVARAEQLAKLVSAAGDRCPKVLRTELIEKINWVAAYSAIRYSGRRRLILWVGWPISLVTVTTLFTAFAAHSGGRAPRTPLGFVGSAFLIAAIFSAQIIPIARVMDWMYARRLLYVKLGGRGDFIDLKFPGMRERGYTSGGVKLLLKEVFGDRDPSAAPPTPDEILAVRRAMTAWEEKPMPWPSKARQSA